MGQRTQRHWHPFRTWYLHVKLAKTRWLQMSPRANKLGKNIYNIGATCNECRGMVECKALKGLCPFTPFDPDQ
ncbi:hypothetical protein KIN20_030875 [Parelaphostrongylus tenuis]|uniref:Uncharacterized protein n=1 Tax=Parelaphostrongylus tenuis TaxID=148309 RepID=A0AAD5R4T4_PARTN|nr:hypothetical protein KIN20_030875 [Parelaphostrongylus tenuis]